MLIAAREMAQDLSLELSSDVSLSGWSEGGAVSMNLQKLIEDDTRIGVNVNTCLAGCYTPSKAPSLTEENSLQIFYMGWLTLSHCMMLGISPDTYFTPSVTDIYSMLETYAESPTLSSIFNQSTLNQDYENIRQIKKSDKLMKLLQALAFQIGSQVSYNELSQICGLSPATIETYIDVLEKCYIVFH